MRMVIVLLRTLGGDWEEHDPVIRNHEDVDERDAWGLTEHVGSCSILSVVSVNWFLSCSNVSTALTLESLFELSYRIQKLFT